MAARFRDVIMAVLSTERVKAVLRQITVDEMRTVKIIWLQRESIFLILTSGCPFKKKGSCLKRLIENAKL